MRNCFLVGICILLFGSCDTGNNSLPDVGMDYFPLKVGVYQIYTVDETQISQSIEQKFVYELKFQVVDSTINQEGEYTYIIQRQKRDNANLPWNNIDSWTARIANRQAIIKDGNTSFVNLSFPTVNGLEWDGNAFNALAGDQYCGENKDQKCDIFKLGNVHEEFLMTGGMTFAETLIVIQNDDPDLITKYDVRKEVYAKKVGLIYKEAAVLQFCTSTKAPDCLGKQKVDKGFRYKQVIKEYGSD